MVVRGEGTKRLKCGMSRHGRNCSAFKIWPEHAESILCSPDLSVLAVGTAADGRGSGDVPSLAEIDAKEKTKHAAQMRMPTGD